MSEQGREFDRDTLARVERLLLRARRVVEGLRAGAHRSPLHGASVEFAEHKEYIAGDSLRHIDWKLFGKSDKYYVKRFEEETNLLAHILVDTSASMAYGRLAQRGSPWWSRLSGQKRLEQVGDTPDAPRTKFEYATLLAASLAYLLGAQGDAVGLYTFGGGDSSYLPPRTRGSHLHTLASRLASLEPRGQGGIAAALTDFAPRVTRRSLVILISDLLEDPDAILQTMKTLRTRRNDVVIFQVLHPDELEFPFEEVSRFEDPEDREQTLVADPREVRAGYLEQLEGFLAQVRKSCFEAQVEHQLLRVDTPVALSISRFLAGRGQGRGRR